MRYASGDLHVSRTMKLRPSRTLGPYAGDWPTAMRLSADVTEFTVGVAERARIARTGDSVHATQVQMRCKHWTRSDRTATVAGGSLT